MFVWCFVKTGLLILQKMKQKNNRLLEFALRLSTTGGETSFIKGLPITPMTLTESQIVERLRKTIAEHAGPVAEADITNAEADLDVRFPISYRVFLKHFGAGYLSGFCEIAGLGVGRATDPEPPQWSHVVDLNLRMRRASRGLIPQEYIRISDDGGDFSFQLDTGKTDDRGECPVVVLGPGRDGIAVAGTFLEFAEIVAAEKLEY